MIEKMKTLTIVSLSNKKDNLLSQIRDMGVLHIKEKKNADAVLSARFTQLQSIMQKLKEFGSVQKTDILDDTQFYAMNSEVVKALEDIKTLNDEKTKLQIEADKQKAWGNFDPSEINEIISQGIDISFYTMDKKELKKLSENSDINYIRLAAVDGMEAIAVIGKADKIAGTKFILPQRSLASVHSKISECEKKISNCQKCLEKASCYLSSYSKQLVKLSNDISWSSAGATAVEDEGLVILSGYIPAEKEEAFIELAKKNSWAYLVDDPEEDDENVPTKVKYSKVSRLMKPVFGILGTIPGYKEYDISFYFLCFFSLFFAMIIGDAGYGFIFLLLGIFLNVKQKKTSDFILLIYVVSVCTIIWGAVTGTWFGLESAMNVGILRALVIKPLANYPEVFGYSAISQQNNMMKFCFIIGTVQLTLACLMNIRRKWVERNDSWIADVGWLLSINSLYYVVLLLVIGENINLIPFAVFILFGFVLVCLFGGMAPGLTFKQGLKSGLGDSFTNFLNTISAFGNIMSYIRLFAVGLASLAIAQSFNDMALGFNGILKIAGILIFIIGHSLNLVMGLLSVVVHGVRLNLLEFSGQLGMEWSGIEYEPFKVSEK